MNRQSILVSIYLSIDNINWETTLQKEKAIKVCTCIFNLYLINGYKFSTPLSLSSNYFASILPSKRDYIIKNKLVDAGILECNHSYSVAKSIAKGYRFNQHYFSIPDITSTKQTFTYLQQTNNSTTSYLFPHSLNPVYTVNGGGITKDYFGQPDITGTKQTFTNLKQTNNLTTSSLFPHSPRPYNLQEYCLHNLSNITFDTDIDNFVTEIATITNKDIILNENIGYDFMDIFHGNKKYRYKKETAIAKAAENDSCLIQYKDNFYFDQPAEFITSKSHQLNLTYCQSIFNIKNHRFYCNRNDTNTRLDYNLTALKKELFSRLKFDGEQLAELDIANAQFAIAAFLNTSIDDNFISLAQTGTLYAYVEDKLGLKGKEGKELMFRIAFDKVRSIAEYENVRRLFPKFMGWVDRYKKEHGYSMFANLLQRTEAGIMIDGLLPFLIYKGYEVFTIHDAIRVKQSQVDEVNGLVVDYFDSISFKCLVRIKGK